MNPNSRNSGRRSGRGSRRSSSRPRSDQRSESRSFSAPAPKSLWQRIVSLFVPNGRKTDAAPRSPERERPRSQRTEPREASARSERPAYEPRSSRKPEAVEVTSPKLYVGNLSFDAVESDLFDLFNGVGKVQNAEVVTHKETEKSKGFGFVIMTSIDEAKRAVIELHDKEFMGRKLVVSGAKTPVDRSA